MMETINIINDLQALKSNKLILWGAGIIGKKLLMVLNRIGIEVSAFCDNNKDLWNSLIDGVPVISPSALSEMAKNKSTLVMVSLRLDNYNELLEQFKKIGISQYISFEGLRQLWFMYKHIELLEDKDGNEVNMYIEEIHGNILLDADLSDLEYILQKKIEFIEYIAKLSPPYPVLLCTSFETGLENLTTTLSDKIQLFDFEYMSKSFDLNILKFCNINTKMIMAVRDPIAQNLSFVETMLKHRRFLEEAYFVKLLKKYSLAENCTYQEMFDIWMKEIHYTRENQKSDVVVKTMKIPRHIQGFMQDFHKDVLDIAKTSFDKEKGYSIIKDENIELFIYQYEKFDRVLSDLGDWLGIEIENSNGYEVNNYADVTNIEFSGEYFDKCYNEPYVKYFYSVQDIEKFKNKWRGDIRRNG